MAQRLSELRGELQRDSTSYAEAKTGRKNFIMNAKFDIWQRGTSFLSAGGKYTADRWKKDDTGSSVTTVTQGIDTTHGQQFFLKVANTTSLASTLSYLTHRIEDVRSGNGRTATLTVDALANSGTGTVRVWIRQYFGSGGSASVDTELGFFAYTGLRDKHSLTFDIPSVSGKTIAGGDDYLQVAFEVDASSPYEHHYYSVQMEEGSEATELEYVSPRANQEDCDRYHVRFNNDLGTVAPLGTSYQFATGTSMLCIPLTTRLRGLPTLEYGALSGLRLLGNANSITSMQVYPHLTYRVAAISITIDGTAGHANTVTLNGASAWLALDAEL